uniref:Uncharacterized protein n=1 Tax=Anopheles atroparvus TaxID=41427 RepID=A0AAG5DB55_ANOAO
MNVSLRPCRSPLTAAELSFLATGGARWIGIARRIRSRSRTGSGNTYSHNNPPRLKHPIVVRAPRCRLKRDQKCLH